MIMSQYRTLAGNQRLTFDTPQSGNSLSILFNRNPMIHFYLTIHQRQTGGLLHPTDTLSTSHTQSTHDPLLRQIYNLLDGQRAGVMVNVDWLADQLAVNRKTLYRKVNTLIQLPPVDLIRQYRLRKAADLLRAGHTVAETADLAGFSTPSHFSLVFKEFYQQTPSEYMSSQIKNA